MTNRLYYASSYETDWTTRIREVVEKDDGIYVTLEESAFYPHGGGQPCDEGTIAGIPVLDVTSEGEVVLHKVAELPEAVGDVECKVEWSRRFDHMQQHSGQHLLSAVCRDLYEAMTVGFHLGADYSTIDVEMQELTPEQMDRIEQESNRQIYRNRAIKGYFVTAEEMSRLPLVKPPKVTEDIRIVEIEGVEYNACGGTHVSSTGEIGMIKLLKAERMKGNIRIYFKCGLRALAEFNESLRILSAAAARFNTGKDELLDRLEKWELEYKEQQAEVVRLKEQLEAYLVQELVGQREGSGGDDGDGGLIVHLFEDKSLKDLQSLAVKLASKGDFIVLLATAAENKVVLAYNGEGGSSFKCGGFFKQHLSAYKGKGGGSDKLAQAGFGEWKDLLAFLEFSKGELASRT